MSKNKIMTKWGKEVETLGIRYDPFSDYVEINGVVFSGEFFRCMADPDPECCYKIERNEHGSVVFTKYQPVSEIERWLKKNEWTKIKTKKDLPEPGVKVIAYFKNEYGKHRRIMAMYVPSLTIEAESEDEYLDYNEMTDIYFLPRGWYEHNEFDERHWFVDGNITHWMPKPPVPVEEI